MRGRIGHDSELCGQDHIIAPALKCLADLHLRISVDVGGIEEIDSKIERAVDEVNGFALLLRAACVDIGDANAHAAEADCRNLQTTIPKSSLFHEVSSGYQSDA